MSPFRLNTIQSLWALSLALFIVPITGCQKEALGFEDAQIANENSLAGARKPDQHKKVGHFEQVNLTANNAEYGAPNIDPSLVNAWGLVFNPNGTPWISSQGGHVSNVYDPLGVPRVINPVNIPSRTTNTGGNPTGIVFNAIATDFITPSNNRPAAFIFAGLDGVISAWNGPMGQQASRITIGNGVYTGLALANSNGQQNLYGADFANGKIDVWGRDWMPKWGFSFTDPDLPMGYLPFNIWPVDNELYVMYAKMDPLTHRSMAGVGLGIVNVFNTDGSFVRRFASDGTLNAPWGVAITSHSFFHDDMMPSEGNGKNYVLVGNFGDGRINVYQEDGRFVGQLRGDKEIIEIEGLWAIMFPPASVDQKRLYFTAGPDDETHGLFGYLKSSAE